LLTREGTGQVASFLGRHSGWTAQEIQGSFGRCEGDGRLLTPGHDATDGFFIARVGKPC